MNRHRRARRMVKLGVRRFLASHTKKGRVRYGNPRQKIQTGPRP